jgi:hypothetical protein
VASISHELRSPLHGILGTLEFIKDTPLDSFQTSMLNSLYACGATLLDTINHVMDYSKISASRKGVSSRRLKNANTVRLSSKPLKSQRKKDPAFDLSVATEEVVEAVFSGSAYIPVTSKLMEAHTSPADQEPTSTSNRKICFVVLEVTYEDDWLFSFPVGSWRRIVMVRNLHAQTTCETCTDCIQHLESLWQCFEIHAFGLYVHAISSGRRCYRCACSSRNLVEASATSKMRTRRG